MFNFIKDSLSSTIICALVLAVSFIGLEPALLEGAATEDQFTISQLVTSEISFITTATDVTLGPSLGGITGGTSNGGTQVIVSTSNTLGYNMTLTASSSLGMLGNTNQSNYIPAYVPSTVAVPDFTFTTPANRARFGYTVEASTTADLAQAFKDDGVNCNTGSADASNSCWLNASTTATTIVNRSTNTAASGSTTTIKFRVVINSNPSPSIPNDTYVATTTLTATTN